MKPMTRATMHRAFTLATIAASLVGTAIAAGPPTTRPNILVILADDYGNDGVGCYGSDRFKDKTPNMNALAKTGTRFDRCFSAPVCGPARCLFITGRYAFRSGGL